MSPVSNKLLLTSLAWHILGLLLYPVAIYLTSLRVLCPGIALFLYSLFCPFTSVVMAYTLFCFVLHNYFTPRRRCRFSFCLFLFLLWPGLLTI